MSHNNRRKYKNMQNTNHSSSIGEIIDKGTNIPASAKIQEGKTINNKNRNIAKLLSAIVIGITTITFILFAHPLYYIMMALSGIIGIIEWNRSCHFQTKDMILGLFIVLPPVFFLMGSLANSSEYPYIMVWYFSIVWATDTFAMLGGKIFQKIVSPNVGKLAPHISPNKTLAGFATGLFAGTLIGSIGLHLFHNDISGVVLHDVNLILMAFLISLLAQAGDLFMSYFKRKFQVKDFGDTIPGHGGVLDRLDSLMLSSPLILWLIG